MSDVLTSAIRDAHVAAGDWHDGYPIAALTTALADDIAASNAIDFAEMAAAARRWRSSPPREDDGLRSVSARSNRYG